MASIPERIREVARDLNVDLVRFETAPIDWDSLLHELFCAVNEHRNDEIDEIDLRYDRLERLITRLADSIDEVAS